MTNETLTTLDDLMVDVWEKGMVYLVNSRDALTSEILDKEGTPVRIGKGLYIKKGIEISPPQGLASRNEGGGYQVGEPGDIEPGYLPMKFLSMTFEVTEAAMEALANGKQDENGFTLEERIESLTKAYGLDKARQGYNDGTGKLAQVNGGVNNTTTVAYNNARAGNPLWFKNQRLSISQYHTSTTPQVTNVKVVSASESWILGTGTVTVSAASTLTDDYWIFREKNENREVVGLLAAVDDGTYSNTYNSISKTDFPTWTAVVDANGGTLRGITEVLLGQVYSDVENNGEPPDLGLTWARMQNRIGNILGAKVSIVPTGKDVQLMGGATAIWYNGKPIVSGLQAPKKFFFWLNRAQLKWRSPTGFSKGWIGGDKNAGNITASGSRKVFMLKYDTATGIPTDSRVAIWREWTNLDLANRRLCGRIDDLDETL